MSEILLRFVHISDTHISADPHYNTDGAPHTPLMGAKALVHQINALPFAPDFVLHTGDVAYNPDESAYDTAHEILSALPCPIYYVRGNHDDVESLQRVMMGSTEPKETLDYEFEVKGVQVICVDSNRPAPNHCGRVSAAQLAWLDNLCGAQDDRPLVVAVHHNVLPIGSPLLDEKMRMDNGEDFHRVLLKARDRMRGVFFGHIHQSFDMVRDGIPYFSALSSWYQIATYGDEETLDVDRFAEPGFNVVTITREQTVVRRCPFIVDAGSMTD